MNILNCELFVRCESKDLNKMNIKGKALPQFLEIRPIEPHQSIILVWKVNILFSSSIYLSTYPYKYTIPCTPCPSPNFLLQEGKENRKQSGHKLELPLSSCSHLQVNLFLRPFLLPVNIVLSPPIL